MRPPVASTGACSSSGPVCSSSSGSCPRCAAHQLDQRLAHQARLPRARHARHRGEHAEREAPRPPRAGCSGSRPRAGASPSALAASAPAARRSSNRYSRVRRLLDLGQPRHAVRCRAPARRARPRAGPTSTIQSAWRMTSSSCSTTKSELPCGLEPVERAEERLGVARVEAGRRLVQHVDHAEQIAVHLGAEPEALELARAERWGCCAPATGSPAPDPSARRAAPPGRWAMRQRDQRLLRVFRLQRLPPPRRAVGATGGRSAASRLSGSRDISAMSCPANLTFSASGLSRLPWQTGHSVLTRNRATRRFIAALSVLANVSSTYCRAPVNVPM